ncbi:arginase family protein [Falsigemmobacter intermedius]|uniref:Agmatinase n=1 Tax=Falsigemmobacter intermedius TaxID=1553448 RepID=A0A451GGN0_9RHOB|nr:arginase family protein [Falsigemmobacter intermedius]RWY36367.1 agmatinase [Falsigemmobacter intermedius]
MSIDTLAPRTFMGVPYRTDPTGARAAILGVPFDCGIHPFRVGSRQGPDAIREQSLLVRPFHPERGDVNLVEALGLVDCGNVRLTPSRIEDAFEATEAAARDIMDAGAIPVGFGGDGSISLPLVRAAGQKYPGLCVIHIDSHTDCYRPDPDHPLDASTQYTFAALEQRVSTSRSWHVGLRGTTMVGGVHDYGRELGYNLVTLRELLTQGPEAVVARMREVIGDRPVWFSFDMDVFDPSCAPGVATPVWGGLSAREGLDFIRLFEGFNIVGADVNTVSPPHDVQGMTAFLAAAVTSEILLLLLPATGEKA